MRAPRGGEFGRLKREPVTSHAPPSLNIRPDHGTCREKRSSLNRGVRSPVVSLRAGSRPRPCAARASSSTDDPLSDAPATCAVTLQRDPQADRRQCHPSLQGQSLHPSAVDGAVGAALPRARHSGSSATALQPRGASARGCVPSARNRSGSLRRSTPPSRWEVPRGPEKGQRDPSRLALPGSWPADRLWHAPPRCARAPRAC